LICLYLYQYLLLWNVSYIVGNGMLSTFQCKFDCANPFSCSWDISRWSFYSYWWPDISVICCHFCTSHTYADSPYLGLSSTTYFVKTSPLVVEIQAEWSLWHNFIHAAKYIFDSSAYLYQTRSIAVAQDLIIFFNRSSNNSVKFWEYSSKTL